MGFREHACVSVLCDRCGDDCWQDGLPHFDDRDEATAYLTAADWLLTTTSTLCRDCARRADCETTGHQFDDWCDRSMRGVPFRARICDHCGHHEYDPPYEHLSVLFGAAAVVNGLERT